MMSPRSTCTDEQGWEVEAGKGTHSFFSARLSPYTPHTHTHTHTHTHIFNKEPEAYSVLAITPFSQRTLWERGCKKGPRGSWGRNGAAFSPGLCLSMHLSGRDPASQVSGELGLRQGRVRAPRARPGGWPGAQLRSRYLARTLSLWSPSSGPQKRPNCSLESSSVPLPNPNTLASREPRTPTEHRAISFCSGSSFSDPGIGTVGAGLS